MITVNKIQKNFNKIIKEPGLKGSFKSLIHPRKETICAVKDVSFTMKKGEIIGLIGPNGAGKSTLIKMLIGILTPTSGFCEINGYVPQENRKKYVKEIGVVFGQRTQLWWDLPLEETYNVLKEIYEVSEDEFKERMEYLNNVLDLQSFIKSPVRTLSLGQRMRADIAASLLHNPKVLFLDEPTIGLDAAVKVSVREAIKDINEKYNTTIILATHDLSDIEILCERLLIIDKGTKIFDGSLKSLKQEFGKMYELKFEVIDVNDLVTLNYASEFNVALDQFKILQVDNLLTVKFNSDKLSVHEVMQYTLSKVKVKDITVKDVDIEEIIQEVYKRGIADV
ncbi:Daunorubicin resistance ATP-binding protein drrA [Carnobacterium maltaromaticum]|uniref:ABC transporter ATP-binding protein n=1 Tax=Carnobacterium maltaromaticum TaxID=2751 RepID=UPI00191B9445|nr:ATP-binding cassette domain-containing protein [Carnobacterium maltaromaticum]CAD5897337.1 Daunorubicin resistance ATP-binding protein drrA [Carnobacterium maltaromaticum]